MGGDGDQGGGAGIVLAADGLKDLAAFGSVALLALLDGGQHQIAVAEVGALGVGDQQDVLRAAVDGFDPDLLVGFADDAEDAVRIGVEHLDDPGFPTVLAAREFGQDAGPEAGGGAGLAGVVGNEDGAGRIGRRLDEADVELAVDVPFDHIGDADGGQGAGFGKALAAALAEFTRGLKLADHFAQGAAVPAFQAEMAGDIGLLGRSGFAQEGEEGSLVGKAGGRAFGRFGHWNPR